MTDEVSGTRVEGGRAAERTALAWDRSALSIALTGGLVAKAGADEGSILGGLAAAGVMLALAAAVWLYGVAAYRRAGTRRSGLFTPEVAHAGLTAISVGAGVVALAILLAA